MARTINLTAADTDSGVYSDAAFLNQLALAFKVDCGEEGQTAGLVMPTTPRRRPPRAR